MRIMIIGNPNAGKTCVFNALTHRNNKVANWSGVTIQASEAPLFAEPEHLIIDLPGFYSLSSGQLTGLEMQFAASQLLEHRPDAIINVVNATQLERHLLLTTQLLELGIPVMLLLTHLDVLKKNGQPLNLNRLSERLGVCIFGLEDYQAATIEQLNLSLLAFLQKPKVQKILAWPQELKYFDQLAIDPGYELFAIRRYLESVEQFQHQVNLSDDLYKVYLSENVRQQIQSLSDQGLDLELLMMDARYQFVHDLSQNVLPSVENAQQRLTKRLDKWLLHRYWGWPIFLTILWVFFTLAVDVGGALQQALSGVSNYFFDFFVNGWLDKLHAFSALKWVIVNGLGQGVTTMISFLPVMACMNLFLSLMESSGYMARVAFLFERIMRTIGLPGKAFLPLLIGFGCNVPAIMSARIVEGSRERLLTVLLSPFMSCSARLTIYAVFASLFFPQYGGWVVLSLYLLGVLMAILTGYFLRKVWLTGQAIPMMIELPMYKKPKWSALFRDVYLRLKLFIIRSGKLVVSFCMILGTLQASMQGGWHLTQNLQHALWSLWQYGLHPIFAPMGIRLENWPAAMGLLTGTMAKEVVIATLNTLYSHIHLQADVVNTIRAPEGVSVYSSKALMSAFGSGRAAYSYLLFVLLYIPCISTLAIIKQEVGRFWQWFALIWSLMLAYSTACGFYQMATFLQHPIQSLVCMVILASWWWVVFHLFKRWRPSHVSGY